MIHAAHQIVLPVIIPLLAAFLLPIAARVNGALARLLGLVAVLASVAFASAIASQVYLDGTLVSELGGFRPPFGIVFYADKLAVLFLLMLTIAMLLFWPHGGDSRIHTLYLLLLAGGSGMILSGDLFNIYVFYEIVSVASFGLAASGRSGAGYAAALRYLILSALGSSLALIGIAILYGATGTLNLADLAVQARLHLSGPIGATAFLLLLLGFGVKAELFPVNSWVPEVYSSAPSRVTALLAGVVSKLSLLVLLRLLVLVFQDTSLLQLLLVVGIVGVFVGEFAAYRARTLNHVLAYSSIAQLGLVAVAFAIPGPAGIFAGVALALHHAVVKSAFFSLASGWGGDLAKLAGAGKAIPVAAALFVLLALSILGIPPLPGFWAKYLLLGGAIATENNLYAFAVLVVLLATVVEAGYMFRIIGLLYGPAGKGQATAFVGFGELMPGLVLGALLLAALINLPQLGVGLAAVANEAGNSTTYLNNVLAGGR